MTNSINLTSAIQLLIDHWKLERYYHADKLPERKPLVISVEGVDAGKLGDLKKFGAPVKVQSAAQSEAPLLAIKVQEMPDGRTQMDFTYSVEGVVGKAMFANKGGAPELIEISVVER
jgi:hypothetical protein